MRDRLIHALVQSKNEAADDLLLEALRLGNEPEQQSVLEALIARGTNRGLGGVVGVYESLPPALQGMVLERIRAFHPALRECGLGTDVGRRIVAMQLIARGRQGRMAYVLSENLHHSDPTLSQPAMAALAELAQWVAEQSLKLRHMEEEERAEVYQRLMEQRPEIEQTVARAMDMHRGRHGQELLRAALLLCDHPDSKTLAILRTTKHGGQSAMVRRLQQPPSADCVAAFLLGASHGALRTHFGIAFAHIEEAPVLDALLPYTHWLKNHQLRICMHQVTRGAWWSEGELLHDLEGRTPAAAAKMGQWIAASGLVDRMQDYRLGTLVRHAGEDVGARLQLLRVGMSRPAGASVELIRSFLEDPDERLVRLAARELIRRRPPEYENMLLQLMTGAPESVRRVIARALGQVGFEHFWQRFDRLDRRTRFSAGQAMMKLLPDAPQRLERKLAAPSAEVRIKAMQIVQELKLAPIMQPSLLALCQDPNARIRSKAVSALRELPALPSELLVERVLKDPDSRVRANAVEVLEDRPNMAFLPLLAQRARSAHNRERANAIKALHRIKVGVFAKQLGMMMADPRAEHRISALWVLKQVGWWQLLPEVGQMARNDENLRVRRYALGVLREVAANVQEIQAKAVG
jgi:HEAT repeat protein